PSTPPPPPPSPYTPLFRSQARRRQAATRERQAKAERPPGQARKTPRAVALGAHSSASARFLGSACGRARLLHRKLPHPAVPLADLPSGGHRLRRALAGPGGDQ